MNAQNTELFDMHNDVKVLMVNTFCFLGSTYQGVLYFRMVFRCRGNIGR